MKLIRSHSYWTLFTVSISISFALGAWYGTAYLGDIAEQNCRHSFTFINPDIVCENQKPFISKEPYLVLQNEIRAYLAAKTASDSITDAAVYFRDLRNGPVFGINEEARFVPASLLKVPLAMILLQHEDETSSVLSASLSFDDSVRLNFDSGENQSPTALNRAFQTHPDLAANTPYPAEELLRRMIAYSDNLAYSVLVTFVYEKLGGEGFLRDSFEELGIVDPTFADDTLSIRTYSSLFRILYHPSYLSPELSEKMLGWLSQSDFSEGLVAGVPAGTRVAHKYGERELGELNQLHDCGIVYFHEHSPYLLCVMTKGKHMDHLATCIADISRMVYEEVDSRHLY